MKKITNYKQLSEGTIGLAPLPGNDAAWKTKKGSMNSFNNAAMPSSQQN